MCINHPVFIYNTRCAEEIATVGKQYPAEPFKFLEPRYMYIFLSLPVYRIMMSIGGVNNPYIPCFVCSDNCISDLGAYFEPCIVGGCHNNCVVLFVSSMPLLLL